MKKKQIFILGYGRSGTTLLRSVLGQHSGIRLINEPEIIFALRTAGYNPSSRLNGPELAGLPDKLRGIGLCKNYLATLPQDILERVRQHEGPLGFKEIYEFLLQIPPDSELIWGEKSLNNIFFIKELFSMYPQSAFIYIVRDPRAVCLSYVNKKRGTGSGARGNWPAHVLLTAEHLHLQRHWSKTAWEAKKIIPGDAWIDIKYEDLIERPETTLTSICSLIGVEREARMLDHRMRQNDPVLEGAGAGAHQNIGQPLDRSRVNAYKKMPLPLNYLAEKLSGDLLREHGYSTMTPSINPGRKLLLQAILVAGGRRLQKRVAVKINRRRLS